MDLTGCFYDDCYLCTSGVKGGNHTRSGAHYSGICLECEKAGKTGRYDGETGRSAYWRTTKFHLKSIEGNKMDNAFTKHINIFHKDKLKDPSIFKLKVESNHRKCLERQIKEGVAIRNSGASLILNSKSEFHQPAVRRVVVE